MLNISLEPFTLKDPKAPCSPAIKSHAMQPPLTWEMAASQQTAQECSGEMLTNDRSK